MKNAPLAWGSSETNPVHVITFLNSLSVWLFFIFLSKKFSSRNQFIRTLIT